MAGSPMAGKAQTVLGLASAEDNPTRAVTFV